MNSISILNFIQNKKNQKEAKQIVNNIEEIEQIEQTIEDDIEQIQTDITAETAARTIADAALKRSLDMLWKLNNGISYVFEPDSAEAYSKSVPSGAVVGDIKSIGGKSVVFAQLVETNFYNGANSEISVDSDGVVTVTAKTSGTGYKFGFRSDSRINSDKNLLIVYDVLCSERFSWGYDIRNSNNNFSMENNAGEWTRISAVQKTFSQTGLYPYIVPRSNITEGFSYKVKNFQIFDLGSEENKDAFFAAFPADYYPYTPPTIISADVDSVRVGGKDIDVPAAIRALPGYGWSAGNVCNEVDFERKKYIQRVNRVDLGTMNFTYFAASNLMGCEISDFQNIQETETIDALCAMYKNRRYREPTSDNMFVASRNSTTNGIVIRDTDYSDANTFKMAMSGVLLYYKIATPIETDISSLLDDSFESIEVEGGGTIEFKQSGDFRLPVPNREEYIVSVAEAGGGA